jgi:hypothetical protein
MEPLGSLHDDLFEVVLSHMNEQDMLDFADTSSYNKRLV